MGRTALTLVMCKMESPGKTALLQVKGRCLSVRPSNAVFALCMLVLSVETATSAAQPGKWLARSAPTHAGFFVPTPASCCPRPNSCQTWAGKLQVLKNDWPKGPLGAAQGCLKARGACALCVHESPRSIRLGQEHQLVHYPGKKAYHSRGILDPQLWKALVVCRCQGFQTS